MLTWVIVKIGVEDIQEGRKLQTRKLKETGTGCSRVQLQTNRT